MSFPATGRAQIYAADRNLFQTATIVVEFAPPLTRADRVRYQVAIHKLIE
ncbi:hypothetical protein ACQ86B_09600 [Mycolicibacterium aichiense]